MVTKDSRKTKDPGKPEVGEIDTSAPFQSVKDAVSLFGEGAFSGERPAIKKEKSHSADRVLAKETELYLAESKLNKLKEQLESAEASKAEALLELALSKQAVVDLTQKLKAIQLFKSKIEDLEGKDPDSIQAVVSELGRAKGSLRKAIEEENSLRSLMETLKLDLDEIKKDHLGLKERELETESNAGNLQVKLRKVKSDLEIVIEEEAKERGLTEETISTLRQMVTENRESKLKAEDMRIEAGNLKREAKAARAKLEEVEEKLKSAVIEAEEAKAAEARALNRIKKLKLLEGTEKGDWVVISRDEFESLGRKAEERERLAEMKVETAMAQVEAVRARENEAVKKLEACRKEIEEMRGGAREALRRAEVAEAARKAVEGELRRWREREEKKSVEVASQKERSFEGKMKEVATSKQEKGRVTTSVGKMKESVGKMKEVMTCKQEKGKSTTSVGKKSSSMPSLSTLFKKEKGSGDWAPSYLPGEAKSGR